MIHIESPLFASIFHIIRYIIFFQERMCAIIYSRNSQKYSGEPVQNSKNRLYSKKYNFLKKSLAMPINSMYTNPCCGMIAVKREVAGSQ